MGRKTQNWVFIDAAERDASGSGVLGHDTCILESDSSQHWFDTNTFSWLPLAGSLVTAKTTDATPEVVVLFELDSNLHTAQLGVWVQSVRDTGVNWKFERLYITMHRTGGVITPAVLVEETPVIAGATIAGSTDAGTGATLTYTIGINGNFVELTITANAAENWDHTARIEFSEAGA